MRGDGLPQRCDAQRVGVTDLRRFQRMSGGIEDGLWRLGARLTDFEMDYIGAARLALVGGAQDIHRDEGRDEPAPGRPQAHVQVHPSGFSIRRVAAG
jgi:hypothetical protein